MKKIHYGLLFGMLLYAATSCKKTTDEIEQPRQMTSEELTGKFKAAGMKISHFANQYTIEAPGTGGPVGGLEPQLEITEAQAQTLVAPLADASTVYMQQAYGIDLSEYFSPGDPRRAIAGKIALRLEALAAENATVNDYWFQNEDYPLILTEDDWIDCALQAIGVQAVKEFLISMENDLVDKTVRKKAMRKMFKQVAKRYLGVVGVAIAVYEFGDCMDWW